MKVLCDVAASVEPVPDTVEREPVPGDVVATVIVVEAASDAMVERISGAIVVELICEVTGTIIGLLLEAFSDMDTELVSRVVLTVPRPNTAVIVLVPDMVELDAGMSVVLDEPLSWGSEEKFVDVLERLERAARI